MYCAVCGTELNPESPDYVEDPDRGFVCLRCHNEEKEEPDEESTPPAPDDHLYS